MTTSKTDKPITEKRVLEGLPEDLPPEVAERFQKLQAQVTEFILHLVQAFLRTGYYTPEHPESKKAKEGLYQQFKDIFDPEDELTFILREEQKTQDILVEGVLPEAQRLGRLMMKGMGELYVPRFAKFLERKEMISLTIKCRMGQAEFTRFVDVMSDPSRLDIHRKEEKDQFAQSLFDRGIFNISFVFNEELIPLEREMPWRARITLSRMRKDLIMIPYFQKMSGEELQEIGKNLIRDAIRGVRQSDLLCAILRNSDLAASQQNPEEVLEDVIVSSFPAHSAVGTSRIFLREHLALKELRKGDPFEQKSDRLLKKLSGRLRELGTKESEGLLEDFFRRQLIGLDDLTPDVKNKILLERLTDKFLGFTQQFFQQLDQAKEKEAFLTLAGSFAKMIPELIRRNRYGEIHRIFETLKTHFYQKKMWALLAGQVLEEIGQGAIPLMLEKKFLTEKKESRAAIIPLFVSLEIGAIPHLLNILKSSEDQWVRKNACEALIEIGPVAAVHLMEELQHQQLSVETTCDILRVLGEIRSQEWKASLLEVLKRSIAHEHPRLREQAHHTFCLLYGAEGEGLFLAGLNDPDLEVKKRAAWCLGIIKSKQGTEKMMEMLRTIWAHPSPDADQLEAQIFHALGLSGNLPIEGKTTEHILLEVLEKRGMKQWWGLFEKNPLSDASLTAILEALGRIGTKESLDVLKKLAKSRENDWLPKLKETLGKIESRVNAQET